MKKKLLLSLIMIICMMLLINVEASAATSKTTIGYPETSLYNENDPNLVPLESGMDLSGRTVYFNTNWNIHDYVPEGYIPDDVYSISFRLDDGAGILGLFNFSLTDDGNTWSYLTLEYYNVIYNIHYNEDMEYGNSNNWLISSFYFSDNKSCTIAEDPGVLEVVFCKADSEDIDVTINWEDLFLVTKEKGQLIPTNSNVVDSNNTDGADLGQILAIGALICMGIFILRSIKR